MNWRTISLLLAVLAVGLGLWGMSEARSRRAITNELNARYQQSFYESLGHAENVEALLSKALAAYTPSQLAQIFTDLRTSALAAQAELTRLPLLEGTLITTGKFLTQVGDFSFTLAKKAASGSPPSEEEMQLLDKMRTEASLITDSLHQIQKAVASGQAPWEEIRRKSNARLRRDVKPVDQGGFTELEEHFEKLPVLQYDGPYSDHIMTQAPKGLIGPEIDEEEAQRIALQFAPVVDRDRYETMLARRVEGRIPAYTVTLREKQETARESVRTQVAANQNPDAITMDISVKGGHVVWMIHPRPLGDEKIGVDEAIERAQAFLEERGFANMTPTYVGRSGNSVVIPFVPLVDGVRIYPDLVKVSVALDNGQVVGFESMNYLVAHTERELGKPRLTAKEAIASVSPHLTVTGEARLALIPLPTKKEVLTWEVPANNHDETYLVYINAETGVEENILRLVMTQEGAMAI